MCSHDTATVRWILLIFCLSLSACTHRLTLVADGGPCLNPPNGYCTPDGSNSLVLEARVYQLSQLVDPDTLVWEDLMQEGKDMTILQPYLTDPSRITMVRQLLFVERTHQQQVRLTILKGTRYLLVVTAGRQRGDKPILLVPLRRAQQEVILSFDQYDVHLLAGSIPPVP